MVFGYLTHRRGAAGSGMRVDDAGQVELRHAEAAWRPITRLDDAALGRLRAAVRESGVLGLPERTPAPANIRGGDTCELWSDLDGGVRAFVEAWTDGNPAAEPSRRLVFTLSELVTAAQA